MKNLELVYFARFIQTILCWKYKSKSFKLPSLKFFGKGVNKIYKKTLNYYLKVKVCFEITNSIIY